MKKDLLVILLLLIISIPAVRELFIPGPFTSHDLTHHIIRQIDIDHLLSEGQFPPRWSGELNNGYGYPLFLFNYPLPPLIGQVFHLSGLGYIDSVKAVLILSMLGSVITMYLFLKSLLDNRLAAALGALFYLYAPARFLTVHVAAALGNATALMIVPLVFLSLNEIFKGHRGWIIGGGVSLALLITAHNVSTLMFAPAIIGFILTLSLRANGSGRLLSLRNDVVSMFVLGLALSAWFWMPAIFEKQFIQYDTKIGPFYREIFVSFKDILYSKWGYGGDFSEQIGLMHWGIIGLLVVYGTWYMVYRKRIIKEFLLLEIFCLVTFVLSILMMMQVSQPVWDNLPLVKYVQFPFRFVTVGVFAASVAAGLLLKYLPYQQWVTVILIMFLLFSNRNHWHINQSVEHNDAYYQTLKTTATAFDEHLPLLARPMKEVSSMKFVVLSGETTVKVVDDKSDFVSVEATVKSLSEIRFNQFYFPGWKIYADDQEQIFRYDNPGEGKGFPQFNLSPGEYKITARFEDTPVRSWADRISLISLAVTIGLVGRSQSKRLASREDTKE